MEIFRSSLSEEEEAWLLFIFIPTLNVCYTWPFFKISPYKHTGQLGHLKKKKNEVCVCGLSHPKRQKNEETLAEFHALGLYTGFLWVEANLRLGGRIITRPLMTA